MVEKWPTNSGEPPPPPNGRKKTFFSMDVFLDVFPKFTFHPANPVAHAMMSIAMFNQETTKLISLRPLLVSGGELHYGECCRSSESPTLHFTAILTFNVGQTDQVLTTHLHCAKGLDISGETLL